MYRTMLEFDDEIDAMIDDWLDRLDPFDPADAANLAPPGNCTWLRHYALRGQVLKHCKGPRAGGCNDTTPCGAVAGIAKMNQRCASARNNLNRECYAGGDPGHIEAVDVARRTVRNCTRQWNRRCKARKIRSRRNWARFD